MQRMPTPSPPQFAGKVIVMIPNGNRKNQQEDPVRHIREPGLLNRRSAQSFSAAGGNGDHQSARTAHEAQADTNMRRKRHRLAVRNCRLPPCQSAATPHADPVRNRSDREYANGTSHASQECSRPNTRFHDAWQGAANETGSDVGRAERLLMHVPGIIEISETPRTAKIILGTGTAPRLDTRHPHRCTSLTSPSPHQRLSNAVSARYVPM